MDAAIAVLEGMEIHEPESCYGGENEGIESAGPDLPAGGSPSLHKGSQGFWLGRNIMDKLASWPMPRLHNFGFSYTHRRHIVLPRSRSAVP